MDTISTDHLDRLLRHASTIRCAAETARAACAMLAIVTGAALVVIALDAAFALPSFIRVGVDLSLAVLFLFGMFTVLREWGRRRGDPRRIARLLEARADIGDSGLINAVELAQGRATPLNVSLANAVLRDVDQRAASLTPSRVVDGVHLRRAAIGLAGVVLLWMFGLLLTPGVFQAVVPRYLEPLADHPPYTLLDFDVTVDPRRVVFGQPATIRVAVTSPTQPPDRADIVFVGPEDQHTAMPLLRKLDVSTNNHEPVAHAAVFVLPVDRAEASHMFYIDTPDGRSKRFRFIVEPVPMFERVTLRYDYPTYTRWPIVTHPLDASGITGLKGSKVTIIAKSNLPLAAGEFELTTRPTGSVSSSDQTHAIELAPLREDRTTVSGSFVLDSSGRFSLSLKGADGTYSEEQRHGPVTAYPDVPPRITITQPGMDVIAPPNWKLPIVLAAGDDVGIERMVLSHRVNDSASTSIELPQKAVSPTYVTAEALFDLEAMSAKAGDEIRYFATAYDHHPGAEQFDETSIAVIHVVSEEEYLQLMRARYRLENIQAEHATFQRQLDQLRATREAMLKQAEVSRERLRAGEKLSEQQHRELAAMAQRLNQYAQQAAGLADALRRRAAQPERYEFEDRYADMLKDLAERLEKQADGAKELGDEQSLPSTEPLAWLDRTKRMLTEEGDAAREDEARMEGIARDFDGLRQADAMVALAQRITSITRRQRELADRLAAFEHEKQLPAADKARLGRRAEEQVVLRDDLRDTLTQLEAVAHEAHETHESLAKMASDALKIIEDIRGLGVLTDQASAARFAENHQPTKASVAATSAAQKLESLHRETRSVEGGGPSQSEGLQLTRQSMGKLMRQLARSRKARSRQSGGGRGGALAGGAMGEVGIVGLASMGLRGGGDRAAGRAARGGRGAAGASGDEAANVESLTPDADVERRTGAGVMRGVPVPFRADAQAYFKRLAEDERR